MSTCPTCGQPVTLAAIENPRNGRWTVLPLDYVPDPTMPADFELVPNATHEAVDLMGEVVGEFPVAMYIGQRDGRHEYRTHPPSHYLGGH